MTKTLQKVSSSTPLFLMTLVDADEHRFSRTLSRAKHGLTKETLSHIRLFFHDIVRCRSLIVIRVAEAPITKNLSTAFGAVMMMDDPLTAGPDLGSKLVGKAQGKYNRSNLSVLGRNIVFSAVREIHIVGESGLFRFVRGYAHAKTHQHDLNTGDAIVEYNVHVLHY